MNISTMSFSLYDTRLTKRVNRFTKKGYEYSLDVKFGPDGDYWTVETFNHPPTCEEIDHIRTIGLRFIEVVCHSYKSDLACQVDSRITRLYRGKV